MQYTQQSKAEIFRKMDELSIDRFSVIAEIVNHWTREKTDEEKAEEAKAKAEAERKREVEEKSRREALEAFAGFCKKKLKGLQLPPRYDFSYTDLNEIMPYVLRSSDELEPVIDGMRFMYQWGFKRGMRCATAHDKERAGKKEQATI